MECRELPPARFLRLCGSHEHKELRQTIFVPEHLHKGTESMLTISELIGTGLGHGRRSSVELQF